MYILWTMDHQEQKQFTRHNALNLRYWKLSRVLTPLAVLAVVTAGLADAMYFGLDMPDSFITTLVTLNSLSLVATLAAFGVRGLEQRHTSKALGIVYKQ